MFARPLALIGQFACDQVPKKPVCRRIMVGYEKRALGLGHTRFAQATPGTLRTKLFKIGAQVAVSVRRILVRMPKACPYQTEFALACLRLGRHAA